MPERSAPNRRPGITHRTIADKLGVSQSTVSLALSGKAAGRVAPELRDAIRALARELGYQPNAAARTLRLGQSQVIALLVPQVDNPFFPPVYLGAERVARAHGYTIALVNAAEQRDTQERALAVDGFVVWRTHALASVDALRQRLVLADDDDPDLPSVQFDIVDGMRQAVAHLQALGHRRIALLAADVDHRTFRLRQDTLRTLLEQPGEPIAGARAELTLDAVLAADRRRFEALLTRALTTGGEGR